MHRSTAAHCEYGWEGGGVVLSEKGERPENRNRKGRELQADEGHTHLLSDTNSHTVSIYSSNSLSLTRSLSLSHTRTHKTGCRGSHRAGCGSNRRGRRKHEMLRRGELRQDG